MAAKKKSGLKLMAAPKNSRAIRLVWADPNSLSDNQSNWRIHNEKQKKAVNLSIYGRNGVGWADVALYNEGTGKLINGHLRKQLAIEKNEAMPVLVGKWTPKEERVLLASLDSTTGMASTDTKALADILRSFDDATDELGELLGMIAKQERIVLDEKIELETRREKKTTTCRRSTLRA